MAENAQFGSIGGGGNYEDEMVKRSPLTSKNLNRTIGYLNPNAKQTFTQLKQAFTKAPIPQHFDPEYHIRTKTNASGYTIGGLLRQLTLDNLSQWYLVAFYSQKMILAKTRYKTYNNELLAIVEASKTCWHYLETCKHKVLIFTN